jgi:hypothetical protein
MLKFKRPILIYFFAALAINKLKLENFENTLASSSSLVVTALYFMIEND